MTMLKIELHRMTRAWYLWGILALLFLGTNAYPIWCGSYTIPEAPLIDISKNIVGPLIASGIYMGLVHSEDLYAGLTRYWIASGVSRTGILLARFIHSLIGSLVILGVDSFLAVVVVNLITGQTMGTDGCRRPADQRRTGQSQTVVRRTIPARNCLGIVLAIPAGVWYGFVAEKDGRRRMRNG